MAIGNTMLSEDDHIRYARQILLEQVSEEGQQKLSKASVLIIGAGGLGVPMASYLAASGVGKLGIADSDLIETSNLHRQVAYGPENVGQKKTEVLKQRLLANNPKVAIQLYRHVSEDNVADLIANYDLIADGCDNFPTRFSVNAACVKQNKPLVSAALSRFDGQIMAFQGGQPCYQCLVPKLPDSHERQGCIDGGILGPMAGIIGCWQALEVIKQLLDMPTRLQQQLLMVDVMNNRQHLMKITDNPNCPVCGAQHEH